MYSLNTGHQGNERSSLLKDDYYQNQSDNNIIRQSSMAQPCWITGNSSSISRQAKSSH